jgi:hypothetical protein
MRWCQRVVEQRDRLKEPPGKSNSLSVAAVPNPKHDIIIQV